MTHTSASEERAAGKAFRAGAPMVAPAVRSGTPPQRPAPRPAGAFSYADPSASARPNRAGFPETLTSH
jgi:hypothetical protein